MVNKLTKRNSTSDHRPPTSALVSDISLQTSDIVSIMDINKIQSALQALKEERAHI